MSGKMKQAGILLGILILPSLFYVILSTGEHQIGRAPFFGPKELHPTKKIKRDIPDTIFYQVPDLSFTDLDGNPTLLSDLQNQIVVVHFYCLSCYESNFRVLEQMAKLNDRFKDKPEVTLLSIVIDSADTKENLLDLPNYPVGNQGWLVWRTDQKWSNIAEDALLLNSEESGVGLHQYALAILDGDRHIRGYYDGPQYVETNAAIDAIKSLRFTYFRATKEKE
jgi:protein SCO1/2